MHRALLRALAAALVLASASAGAQVYRCGATGLYTDKPCEDASPVDVRPNLLDAGTRRIPADPPPAPAVIPPGAHEAPRATGASDDLWSRRNARDAESRARTGPYRP